MQITITGDGIEVTDALRKQVDKFKRLEGLAGKTANFHITLSLEHLEQVAKVLVKMHGTECYATAKAKDLYTAIDELIHKVERQIIDEHKKKRDAAR